MRIDTSMIGRRAHTGFVLLFAAAGAFTCGEMLKRQADIWHGAAGAGGWVGWMCGGSDCDGTNAGPLSEIAVPIPALNNYTDVSIRRVPVPLAFLGLAYFAFIGVWFFLTGAPRTAGLRRERLPLYAARFGILMSIVCGSLMAAGHAPLCRMCIAAHAINGLLFVSIRRLFARASGGEDVGAFESDTANREPAGSRSAEPFRVLAVSLAVVAGLWWYRHEHLAFKAEIDELRPDVQLLASLREDPAFLLREFLAQPPQEIPAREGDASPGDRPRLVLFTDFQCPACRCAAKTVRDAVEPAFHGRLDVSIRHYPLCVDCNRTVRRTVHRQACEAAFAVESARLIGGPQSSRAMHDLVFENMASLATTDFRKLATQLGLDSDQFTREMQGEAVRSIVESDVALASKLAVKGTPTLFLDGRRVPTVCQTPAFWRVVANELAGK